MANEIELWDPNPEATDWRYLAWSLYEESRGELAGVPEFLECYKCSGYREPYVERKVVKLGRVVNQGYYPTGEEYEATQTYVLECGHTTI